MFENIILSEVVDVYTVWHALAGLVIGFAIYNLIKDEKIHFELAVGLPILWEIIEVFVLMPFFTEYFAFIETIENSICDAITSIVFIVIGIFLAKKYGKII